MVSNIISYIKERNKKLEPRGDEEIVCNDMFTI